MGNCSASLLGASYPIQTGKENRLFAQFGILQRVIVVLVYLLTWTLLVPEVSQAMKASDLFLGERMTGHQQSGTAKSVGAADNRPKLEVESVSAKPTIDGKLDEKPWKITNAVSKSVIGTNKNKVTFGVLWDAENLYIGVQVLDPKLKNDASDLWENDSLGIYIDADNNRGSSYDSNDRQFVKGWNDSAVWEQNGRTAGVEHAWAPVPGGYTMEFAIPWKSLAVTPAAGLTIGFDIGNNDNAGNGFRDSQSMWAGTETNWENTSAYGMLTLARRP